MPSQRLDRQLVRRHCAVQTWSVMVSNGQQHEDRTLTLLFVVFKSLVDAGVVAPPGQCGTRLACRSKRSAGLRAEGQLTAGRRTHQTQRVALIVRSDQTFELVAVLVADHRLVRRHWLGKRETRSEEMMRRKKLTDDFQRDDSIDGARLLKVDATAIVARVRQSDRVHVQEGRSVVHVEIGAACNVQTVRTVNTVMRTSEVTHRPVRRRSGCVPGPADLCASPA